MTRRDFQMIAGGIARARTPRDPYAPDWPATREADNIARALADRLATTNPRFDRARFLRAAGVTD